ncbi:hypothetical protein TRFO_18923 [Tritrichomonas foetus]|uniref:Uncharacterized protein n=1 Tax=Tritrichomonas foetus TaxID=1144522 RepID=A0A1J4KPD2_9EUKA|nr:hypothetical protein TRFO_18923 [Tritrichomonas foetus]|eukprot:OHT11566.1 hypothetical protein TRFO_18923 [Tritrichomonas foetus]
MLLLLSTIFDRYHIFLNKASFKKYVFGNFFPLFHIFFIRKRKLTISHHIISPIFISRTKSSPTTQSPMSYVRNNRKLRSIWWIEPNKPKEEHKLDSKGSLIEGMERAHKINKVARVKSGSLAGQRRQRNHQKAPKPSSTPMLTRESTRQLNLTPPSPPASSESSPKTEDPVEFVFVDNPPQVVDNIVIDQEDFFLLFGEEQFQQSSTDNFVFSCDESDLFWS